MVVIRNVFRLKFGKAREAVALFKESIAIGPYFLLMCFFYFSK